MLKKIALDKTKEYEKYLILEELAQMLVAFVQGHSHHLAIGAEQGGIDKWDDLVIQKNSGGFIYVQAKKQTTDFSSFPATRDRYTTRKGEDKLRDLSPLDETFQSLGKRIKNSSSSDLYNEFWLELPDSSIKIKKGLEIRHLRDLRENQIKDVTTADDLRALAAVSPSANKIYYWLTTWCDYSSWEHILTAFKCLSLKASGFKSDIKERAKRILGQVFQSAKIDEVCMLILSYMDENATYAGVIKPRQLLFDLKNYMLPNVERWTSFQTDGSSWNISGIFDLEENNKIERPSVVVPALLGKDIQYARSLIINGNCIENCRVSEGLSRLLIHSHGIFNTFFSEKAQWENSINIKTGGTLGDKSYLFDDLRLVRWTEQFIQSSKKELKTLREQEDFAEELHEELYKVTLEYICSKLRSMIREMSRGELRDRVEERWEKWKQSLENNMSYQRELFSKILRPKAEGESISGELRVGPQTAKILSEAIFLLLVISVCLADDQHQDWTSVSDSLKITSIGLAYWSGPADTARKVIRIDEDPYIGKLLENESEQIVIIPQSGLSETEIFKDDLLGDTTKISLLTHPKCPKLLITRERFFAGLIEAGDISKITDYLQENIDKYNSNIEVAINKVIDGVIL